MASSNPAHTNLCARPVEARALPSDDHRSPRASRACIPTFSLCSVLHGADRWCPPLRRRSLVCIGAHRRNTRRCPAPAIIRRSRQDGFDGRFRSLVHWALRVWEVDPGGHAHRVLPQRGVHVESLDGDVVRTHLSRGWGSPRDRDTNIRRIGFVAKLVAKAGGCAVTAAISPYREIRDEQRRAIGRFCEVYCECPINVLAKRDVKGLYARALAGEIKGFTGVDDPYEPPQAPEVVVRRTASQPTRVSRRSSRNSRSLDTSRRPRQPPAETTRKGLVLPHGGELVDRFVRGDRRRDSSNAQRAAKGSARRARCERPRARREWSVLTAQGVHDPPRLPPGRSRTTARETKPCGPSPLPSPYRPRPPSLSRSSGTEVALESPEVTSWRCSNSAPMDARQGA